MLHWKQVSELPEIYHFPACSPYHAEQMVLERGKLFTSFVSNFIIVLNPLRDEILEVKEKTQM